jgi:DNA-binding response OmpR family regulator
VIGMLWTEPDIDEVTALDLGADDCVARPVSFRQLVARTNAVLRRTATPEERHLRYDILDIDLASRTVRVRGDLVELAAREFDLLAFLAGHPGEVFTREQLLANVWRSSHDWQQRETVTEHVHRVRSRLEDDPARPRWLLTVRGVGYRFSP